MIKMTAGWLYLSNWRFTKVGLEDLDAGFVVRQWDVDELIKTAWTQDGRVNDVRSIGGSNDEDILL